MTAFETLEEMTKIPEWSYSDFVSEAPFEWLYKYVDQQFLMLQLRDIIKAKAKEVGFNGFIQKWNAYVKTKASDGKIELSHTTEFDGQSNDLYCGDYSCTDDGISYINRFGMLIVVCRHPISIVRRLVNIDSNETKLEIEFCRGGRWKKIIIDRSILASSQKILDLSSLGIAVDSENAKELVKYITFLESQNYDKLGETSSVGRLGWIPDCGFSPYVDGLEFDGNLSFQHMFSAVKKQGDINAWLEVAKTARAHSLIVRVVLAASFASVLVEPLGCLPFFTHIWGTAGSGKTVCLMLAASVWANPAMGEYVKTFNTTAVGMELLAGFCNSLPLCLDELQIVKDRADFDKTIYTLTEGIGKGRGAKTGGLQKTYTWRNCIITTGEMPITNANSGGGAVNRVIDIDYSGEHLFDDPRGVANTIRKNYGFAGQIFVHWFNLMDKEEAENLYKDFYEQLIQNETTEKQAMAGALILTADRLSEKRIFSDGVLIPVSDMAKFLTSKDDADVNRRALIWLYDFVMINSNHFNVESVNIEIWGEIDEDEQRIYIIEPIFAQKMKDAGYNATSFKSWAKNRNLLITDKERNTKVKRIKGTKGLSRCICIRSWDALEQSGEIETDDVSGLPI